MYIGYKTEIIIQVITGPRAGTERRCQFCTVDNHIAGRIVKEDIHIQLTGAAIAETPIQPKTAYPRSYSVSKYEDFRVEEGGRLGEVWGFRTNGYYTVYDPVTNPTGELVWGDKQWVLPAQLLLCQGLSVVNLSIRFRL